MHLCVCKAEGWLSLTQLFTLSWGLVDRVWAPRGQACSCFGLYGVSAVVGLSWQPRREDLLKAECGLTPAHGLSVLCRRRQLGATGSVQGQCALRVGNVGLE